MKRKIPRNTVANLLTLTSQDFQVTWGSCIQWHEVSNDTFDIVFDKIRN